MLSLRLVTEMSDNPPYEQRVFQLWPLPDVVNNKMTLSVPGSRYHNETDMKQPVAQLPCHDIPWTIDQRIIVYGKH